MNDLTPQDFDPENICVQVIARARILYETNEYPSNYEGQTFASAREDALTFFHSKQFERMCTLLNLPAWKVRGIADVPQPTPLCRCENCRTDYTEEARLVQSLPRQQRFRFAIGEKHTVRYTWKGARRDIVEICPQCGHPQRWLSATEYLNQTENR
jgi:hypothetical protein